MEGNSLLGKQVHANEWQNDEIWHDNVVSGGCWVTTESRKETNVQKESNDFVRLLKALYRVPTIQRGNSRAREGTRMVLARSKAVIRRVTLQCAEYLVLKQPHCPEPLLAEYESKRGCEYRLAGWCVSHAEESRYEFRQGLE